MNHQITRLTFAFGIGIVVAVFAYRWIIDPAPRVERVMQESVVAAARNLLEQMLEIGTLEVVDPLTPDRKIGKTYVFPAAQGWQVSGYYRRDDIDLWHPFLMTLDDSLQLTHLKVSDPVLFDRVNDKPLLEVLR